MDREEAWEIAYRKGKLQWRGTTNFDPQMPPGARFLEIGVGNGKNLSALLEHELELYAIDSSAHGVAQAKEVAKERGKECTIEVMDARGMRYADGFFQGIACFHTLGNMLEEDRKTAAKEITRVLAKGGTLFFRDFGQKDFRNGKGTALEENTFRRRTGVITHYFTIEEVKSLFPTLQAFYEDSEQFFVHYDGKKLLRERLHVKFKKK